jgi:glycosyltransferase involved in cell wall biosynthesis|tara:strand:+ start:3359 stop:4387 length:1029 start_codon:yes stop_codon:yes gene_type:complete
MYSTSIIIPAYNSEETIEPCLEKIINESKNFISEIIVVDDNSNDKTVEIVKKFKSVKLIKLSKNRGAGNARNKGAKIAKHETLCFVDSDIIISKDSIEHLVKRLHQDENIASVSGIPEISNLNVRSWTSNFVCLKSCYGNENIEKEKEFSHSPSEFCAISKKFFIQMGGYKPLRNAGGEEFYLGYQINQLNKKNIKIIDASFKGKYCSLYLRFKRIIDRTEKYIPLLFKKKKFDTTGSGADLTQAFSSLLTLIILILILLVFALNKGFLLVGLFISFVTQIIIELKFLLFAKKHFGFKMLFFSLFGIQVINLAIFFGTAYFFFNMIKKLLRKVLSFRLLTRE